jgi:N utilization substance protein A
MKSEFILAFNEIAELRKLPREVILEALKAALVSAYRHNVGASAAQYVEARIDEKTGTPTIWVEKEVVEVVQNPLTEISLEEARKIKPDVQLGETVIAENTPKDFGRIAAQNAKQVILQRMREAEREAQFQEYQERIGDLVTGTVQSDSGDVVTIGLGRTEAILPRSQQVPGERYKVHDRIRAYVMDVRRSNRGPQIIVSRTHRNMLRRLLEYEVPEIYNGTVEIKSIAREPGARSKVAVAALQEGADPVGACVGMRGVRIQSIVKELGEKIDVIEWSPDQAVFISKALSPARVSCVFLDDDPEEGRTASVVVPDDQLSLAIGREGQNARLAAKLTGWRIDIKSVTEAAQEALVHIREPQLADLAEAQAGLIAQVEVIMEKKAANRTVTPEEYQLLVDFIRLVEGRRLELREADRVEQRARQEAVRAQIPPVAYQYPLEDTDLPLRVFNLLSEAGYSTVGEVMEQYELSPKRFMSIPGFTSQAFEAVEHMLKTIEFPSSEAVAEAVEAEPTPEFEEVQPEEVQEPEPVVEVEEVPEPMASEPDRLAGIEEGEEISWSEDEELARARRAALVAQLTGQPQSGEVEVEMPLSPEVETKEKQPERRLGAIRPETIREPMIGDEDEEDLYEYEGMTKEEVEIARRQKAKQRRRQLIYDEELGQIVSKRRRKPGRVRGRWDSEEE